MPEEFRRYKVCRMFGYTEAEYDELSAGFTDMALMYDTTETRYHNERLRDGGI